MATAVVTIGAGVALATSGSGITSTNISVGPFDNIRVHTMVDPH
jgi:hypothetical protein